MVIIGRPIGEGVGKIYGGELGEDELGDKALFVGELCSDER